MRARIHLLGADHGRHIGQAPGVDVKHGHDRQDHVVVGQIQRVRRGRGHGVEHAGAVRIDHALGLAGGARGVAHAAGVAFVLFGVDELALGGGQEILVAFHAVRHGLAGQRHHDDLLEVDLVGELFVQRQQHVVDDEETILGVIDDPGHVVRRQAQVQGVQYRAGDRNAEIRLQVRGGVPGKGRDPIAVLDPGLGERLSELLGASDHVGIGLPVQRLVRHVGDDFHIAELRARALENVVEQQRPVHHRGLHEISSGRCSNRCKGCSFHRRRASHWRSRNVHIRWPIPLTSVRPVW